MAADIERQMADADATLTAAEGQVASAKAKIATLRAMADQVSPNVPYPRRSSAVTYLRWLLGWARMISMIWTHRIVRLAPGAYLQIQRGMSNERLRANLAAYLRNLKQKGK